MNKSKLKVDVRVSESVSLLSTVLKILGWICLVICLILRLANADEPSGGYYDNPHGVHVGLNDFISSLFIILMGTIVKGLAIITKSAEMSIATAKQNYDIEEVTDEINVSE